MCFVMQFILGESHCKYQENWLPFPLFSLTGVNSWDVSGFYFWKRSFLLAQLTSPLLENYSLSCYDHPVTELVRLAAVSLQLLKLGSILNPRLFLRHAAKYFSCSTGTICYPWARYCPSWADTSVLQPRTLTDLFCLYHEGGIGMDELIVGLGPFNAASCCFLGNISNMSTHLFLFRNISRLFPELTTECSYKSVAIGLLLLFLTYSLLTAATDRAV